MPFRVMLSGSSIDPVYAIDPATGNFWEFETGAEAQAKAKELALAGDDQKWRVKRVVDTKWKSRERRKLEDGTYTPVPWVESDWWYHAEHIHAHHFPHVSTKELGMIAYTASAEQGMDNKHTMIKPGRYLEKYFSDIIARHGLSIKKLAMDFDKRYRPRTVHFAKTADEIQWVYEHGPDSCMSSRRYRERHGYGYPNPGDWPNDTHACRIYAFGGLQVAYITESDKPDDKNVVARALVWPEKMTHSRVYGDFEASLRQNLRVAGYQPQAPIGAKLERIEVEDTGLFVCPYIDVGHGPGGGATGVKDCGDHLEITVLTAFQFPANTTSGLCGNKIGPDGRPLVNAVERCQVCNAHMQEAGGLYQVFRSGANDFRMWCSHCIRRTTTFPDGSRGRAAFECDYNGRYYDATRVRQHQMANGQTWCDPTFRSSGFTCDATGKKYHIEKRVVMYNGQNWCVDHYRIFGIACRYSGDHFPKSECTQLKKVGWIANIHLALRTFECESCNETYLKTARGKHYCTNCEYREWTGDMRLREFKVPQTTEEYTYDAVR